MRHMHQADGANPSALTIFCPCGVVQPTCLPLMQEITGAKPVRDAIFSARGSRGIADPPGLERAHLDTVLDFWGILEIPQEFANSDPHVRTVFRCTRLEPGSLGRASRLAPTIFDAPKAF